jgi:hypothetical protein
VKTKLATIVICILLLVVAGGLDARGRAARHQPPGGVRAVSRPADVPGVLREAGAHGVALVSLSARYHIRPYDLALAVPAFKGWPVRPVDPAATAAERLAGEEFVLVAIEEGLARTVTHVLPGATFRERFDPPPTETVESFYFATPRYIASGEWWAGPAGPVVLYVDASYFRGVGGREAAAMFRPGTITMVVYCELADDPSMGASARAELAAFLDVARGLHVGP